MGNTAALNRRVRTILRAWGVSFPTLDLVYIMSVESRPFQVECSQANHLKCVLFTPTRRQHSNQPGFFSYKHHIMAVRMKTILTLALLSAEAVSASRSLSSRNESGLSAGTSWMGTNLYYLQGLSDSDQDAYIDAMSKDGAEVIRLWVNKQTAGACQKGSLIDVDVPDLETTIGEYNDETLDALDAVLVKLSDKGIKALISPHDSNSLLGDYRA